MIYGLFFEGFLSGISIRESKIVLEKYELVSIQSRYSGIAQDQGIQKIATSICLIFRVLFG